VVWYSDILQGDLSVIALYARVSHEEQNLSTQKMVLSKWVEDNGRPRVKWYLDDGSSGDSLGGRPGLSGLRKESRSGLVDRVVVYKLDRLSRKAVHGLHLLHELIKNGVVIQSVMEGLVIDPVNDASGTVVNIVAPLLLCLAQNEQYVRRQRVRSGVERAKAEGKYRGRKKGSLKVKEYGKVVEYVRAGLSLGDIGKLMGISRATVYRYMDRSLGKELCNGGSRAV